jgi:hypothetical protein
MHLVPTPSDADRKFVDAVTIRTANHGLTLDQMIDADIEARLDALRRSSPDAANDNDSLGAA